MQLFNFSSQLKEKGSDFAESSGPGIHVIDILLQWFVAIMLICYAILIVTIWHNVLRFVIGQKRYKSLHITYFYCLTAVVCFLRIFWFCLILTVTIK